MFPYTGLIECHGQLFRRSPGGGPEGTAIGVVEMINGAAFHFKATCLCSGHAPPDPTASRKSPEGRQCFIMMSATHQFESKLARALSWLADAESMSRDEHLQRGVDIRREFGVVCKLGGRAATS